VLHLSAVLLAPGAKGGFFFFSTTIDMRSFTGWSCRAPRHLRGTSQDYPVRCSPPKSISTFPFFHTPYMQKLYEMDQMVMTHSANKLKQQA
jgi:hypothetical protein